MIQTLNNILNKIFIGIKYIVYLLSIILFIMLYPLLITLHKWKKRTFSHPNIIMFYWVCYIERMFNKVIF